MIGLSLKYFEIKDHNTYLAPLIRLFTYFLGRGKYHSVKWHHSFGYFDTYIIEAVAKGVVKQPHQRLSFYDKVVILDFNFAIDREGFKKSMEGQIGTPYAFGLVLFYQAIYQTTGIWLKKTEPIYHHCTTSVCKAIYDNCLDPIVKEKFKKWYQMDTQDLVRIWISEGLLKEIS